jgi:O-antigen ligase
MPSVIHARPSLRLFVVCFAALAASLPMVWITMSKLLLFTTTLGYLLVWNFRGYNKASQLNLHTTKVLMVIVLAFSCSLLWTEVDLDFALRMWIKHIKLLQILLLVYLVRSVREALLALKVFALVQIFVLTCSWLLAAGLALPWARTQLEIGTHYVVFSESYLDQSIMLAVFAGVVWHLHAEWKWSRYLTGAIALAALLNVLLLLPGRTGYLACFVVAGLAAMWGLPRKARWALLVGAPLLLTVVVLYGSNQFATRLSQVLHESQNYSQNGETTTSSGWRLNAWRRSLQAIEQKPLLGHGVGSWTPAVKRMDGERAIADFGVGNSSNPHQEFLLWGVELGIGGALLLIALLLALVLDARRFAPTVQRATHTALAVTALACLFNSSLYDAQIGDFLCTAVGLLMALGVQMQLASTAGVPEYAEPHTP